MALICVGSARGAPGATTLAVLLAGVWPRPSVLVEADADGGVLAVRYGLARNPGLAGLAAAVRDDPSADALWRCAQALPGDLPAVVAPDSGDVTTGILDDVAAALGRWLSGVPAVDVIADCGRLGPSSPAAPVLAAADEVLVAVRSRADQLYPTAHRVRSLAGEVGSCRLVLIGDRPHGPDEVTSQLQVPVAGVVADDARAAAAMVDGGSDRVLRRSALIRSVRTLADDLVATLGLPTTAGGGAAASTRSEPHAPDASGGSLGAAPDGPAPFPAPPPRSVTPATPVSPAAPTATGGGER